MTAKPSNVLIIGYGNPGRRDDGLGPALVAALEARDWAGVSWDADYQLTVEHAADAAQADVVVFVDAACNGPEPFSFAPVHPGEAVTFSSHSTTPESVLALAEQSFGRVPQAYVLGIRGYEFDEFGESLSTRAQDNLAAAIAFIEPLIEKRTFSAGVNASAGAPTKTPVSGEH